MIIKTLKIINDITLFVIGYFVKPFTPKTKKQYLDLYGENQLNKLERMGKRNMSNHSLISRPGANVITPIRK